MDPEALSQKILSVHPQKLIACYGKPRRPLGARPQRSTLAAARMATSASSPSLGSGLGNSCSSGRPSSTLSGSHILSAGQLKYLIQRRPHTSPEIGSVETTVEPYCAACFGGFCVSAAFPHGPDGYHDHGRCRRGPRPQSQTSQTKLADAADAGPSSRRSWTRKIEPSQRRGFPATAKSDRAIPATVGSSLEKWSSDGNSSFDMADFDDFDVDSNGDPNRNMSPLGGTWTRAQKHEKKGKNPFVECQDHEQRLTLERKWLLEDDGLYMQEKKKDLKHNAIHKYIDLKWQDVDDLYQKSVFYGPYSMSMQENKTGHKAGVRLEKPEVSGKGGATGKRNGGSKKGESAEVLAHQTSAVQVKALQRQLEKSTGQFSEQEAPKKVLQPTTTLSLSSGLKDLFRRKAADCSD